jgi:hypothetical protein
MGWSPWATDGIVACGSGTSGSHRGANPRENRGPAQSYFLACDRASLEDRLLNIGFSVFGLFALFVLGGVYAVVASTIARRYGARRLGGTWPIASVGIAVVGALRTLGFQRNAGVDPARISVPGLYTLLATAMLITLSVPTLFLWRRRAKGLATGVVRAALIGTGGTVAGLVLTVLIALVLDLLNVPFIPIR